MKWRKVQALKFKQHQYLRPDGHGACLGMPHANQIAGSRQWWFGRMGLMFLAGTPLYTYG
jgi:hypothetical protein